MSRDLAPATGELNPIERVAAWFILLHGIRAWAVAFLAGAISALGLAPLHLFPVLFLTIPVLVWLLDGAVGTARRDGTVTAFARYRSSFAIGWWFGFGYLFAGLWWVGMAFLVDAEEFIYLLPVALIALPAGLAIFYGLGAAIARIGWGYGWVRLVSFAASFALVEWLRGTVLTGLPWNTLGQVAMPTPLAMQSAGLVGLYGVTLLTLFVCASPAIFAPATLSAPGTRPRPRRVRAVLAGALALLAAHIVYGFVILSNAPDLLASSGARVRIVQPAIDQKEKWKPENASTIARDYLDLSNIDRGPDASGAASFDYIVWPESAFPFVLMQQPDYLSAIGNLLPDDAVLITGAMRLDESEGEGGAVPLQPTVYNTLYTIDGAGAVIASYDKTRLLPFGEFLPFQTSLESIGLQQLTRMRGGFAPGTRRAPIKAGGAPPFLPLICYEIIFPAKVAGGTGERAGWIVNLTNDAWFGNTPGPWQHAHQSRVRAVEEGLPLVRAANTGISMIADPYGRIVARLGLGERGVVDGRLPQMRPPTVFSRTGNWAVLIAIMALLTSAAIITRRTTDKL